MFHDLHKLAYGVVIADAGDFAPAPQDSHRAEIAAFLLEGMAAMQYDVVGVGEMDLALGPAYLHEAAKRLPLVGANVRFGPALAESLPAVRWVEKKGKKIAVTGIIDPLIYFESEGAFEMAESLMVGDAVLALRAVMAQIGEAGDAVVVLIHADRTRAIEILEGIGDLPRAPDIAVVGHEPLGPRAEEKVGRTFILQPGPRSREVSLFTLTYADSGSALRAGLEVHRLANLTGGDPEIDAMTKAFQAKHRIQ